MTEVAAGRYSDRARVGDCSVADSARPAVAAAVAAVPLEAEVVVADSVRLVAVAEWVPQQVARKRVAAAVAQFDRERHSRQQRHGHRNHPFPHKQSLRCGSNREHVEE